MQILSVDVSNGWDTEAHPFSNSRSTSEQLQGKKVLSLTYQKNDMCIRTLFWLLDPLPPAQFPFQFYTAVTTACLVLGINVAPSKWPTSETLNTQTKPSFSPLLADQDRTQTVYGVRAQEDRTALDETLPTDDQTSQKTSKMHQQNSCPTVTHNLCASPSTLPVTRSPVFH